MFTAMFQYILKNVFSRTARLEIYIHINTYMGIYVYIHSIYNYGVDIAVTLLSSAF